MRSETIECNICREPIVTMPEHNSRVALRDVCVVMSVQVAASRVVLDERYPVSAHGHSDNTIDIVLHICFSCAEHNLAGWWPIEGFHDAPRIPAAPSSSDAQPAVCNAKLNHLRRYLDVVVEDEGGAEHVLSATLEAWNTAGEKQSLVTWPVGSAVKARVVDGQPRAGVVVVGYQVKPKEKFSWDTVSPVCAKCDKPTEYGERVTVRDAGPQAMEAICAACSPKPDAEPKQITEQHAAS